MSLRSYIITHDTGFAPNPFGRVCTLACCKPKIRSCAKEGDTVIGTGSVELGLSGRLIFAMQVERVLPFEEYWECYPSKRPSQESHVRMRGDNIWHRDARDKWRCLPGAVHDESDRDRDTSGRNVLISSDFYYFGRRAITIPNEFRSLVAVTQGHKRSDDLALISRFWKWVRSQARRRGRNGVPNGFDGAVCQRKGGVRARAKC